LPPDYDVQAEHLRRIQARAPEFGADWSQQVASNAQQGYDLLETMPRAPRGLTTYRGVSIPQDIFEQMVPGARYLDRGLQWSSFDPRIATSYGNQAPRGHRQAFVEVTNPPGSATPLYGGGYNSELIHPYDQMWEVTGNIPARGRGWGPDKLPVLQVQSRPDLPFSARTIKGWGATGLGMGILGGLGTLYSVGKGILEGGSPTASTPPPATAIRGVLTNPLGGGQAALAGWAQDNVLQAIGRYLGGPNGLPSPRGATRPQAQQLDDVPMWALGGSR
jgi:hypothetical protein